MNLIAILLLSRKAFKTLKSYERQEKEGKEPVFDPKEIGIEGAEYWEEKMKWCFSHAEIAEPAGREKKKQNN